MILRPRVTGRVDLELTAAKPKPLTGYEAVLDGDPLLITAMFGAMVVRRTVIGWLRLFLVG